MSTGVVVDVLAVAQLLPVFAAVLAANNSADLNGAVQLIGVGRNAGNLQHPFGQVGAGSYRDLGEPDAHRKLLPALAAVVAPVYLGRLVTGKHNIGVSGMEQQRPNRQPVVRHVNLFPVVTVVLTAVWPVLGAYENGAGALGVDCNGPNGGRIGQAVFKQLPSVVPLGHPIQAAGYDSPRERSRLPGPRRQSSCRYWTSR